MIGVSLPYEWLAGKTSEPLGDPKELLVRLRNRGVDSIELRTVFLRHDPKEVLRVAEFLWDLGFSLTVHVKAHDRERATEEVFAPVREVLEHLRQEKLTLTLHPVKDDNAAMLRELAAYRDAHGYPVVIALENNRLLPDKTEGDCAALVFDAVYQADQKDVGICFDFGHFLYFRKKHMPRHPEFYPAQAFFDRVVHTHIHALSDLKTHFPLPDHEIPLQELTTHLGKQYTGVYNLELDFPRFWEEIPPIPALLASVDFLQNALSTTARVLSDVRQFFDRRFLKAVEILKSPQKNTFALIHSASYLFCTNGFRWAMDISFRKAYELAKTPSRAGELLRDLDLIVVTHGHADHFEEQTVRQLAENDTLWLIPDFLTEKALAFGIRPEKMCVVHVGDVLTVGPLTIRVFEGFHFRPITKKGVPAYGYHVSAENEPSLVFPTDVRDFDPDGSRRIPHADYCFAHVWLGDDAAQALKDHSATSYAAFLHRLSPAFFLTHLYENGRKEKDMWTREHAERLACELRRLSPEAEIKIPESGDIIALTKPKKPPY